MPNDSAQFSPCSLLRASPSEWQEIDWGVVFASTGSGDFVSMRGLFGFMFVPQGYVSGAALSDSITFNNATFASLGLTPGTYVCIHLHSTWVKSKTPSTQFITASIRFPSDTPSDTNPTDFKGWPGSHDSLLISPLRALFGLPPNCLKLVSIAS
jgi:hypothetical protein